MVVDRPAPTYETATTRAYYNGRTETVRSCTQEAVDWCRQMMAKNQANATIHRKEQRKRLELFKKACQQHDRLMNEARKNFGCDRHLLGLMLMSKELGLDCHEIFEDPAWKKRSAHLKKYLLLALTPKAYETVFLNNLVAVVEIF